MKKVLIQFILAFLFFNLGFSQGGWQRIYPTTSGGVDGDGIHAVCQTPDGGYIMAGIIDNNSAASKNRVVKVDYLGNIQWSNTYFDLVNNQSWATNVKLAPNGGYFVEGINRNAITYLNELYIQHLDANGNELWTNFYPQANVATQGSVTNDGGYVAIGYDYDNVTNIDSVVLIKINASGNLDFITKHSALNVGIVHSTIQTTSGEYIVEGFFNNKTFLSKFDANGGFLWRNLYGVQAAHPEYIGKVVENSDGSLTVAGNDALTWGAHDFYLFKTDSNGQLLWDQHYGQTAAMCSDIAKTTDGGYIITGFKNYNTSPKIVLLKTNSLGEQEWIKEYSGDGTGSWKAYSVEQTDDGGYILGGTKVSSFYQRENMYLVKTDELGEIYSNTLNGFVYDDFNNNCIKDAGEYVMANRVLQVVGDQTFWTSTDSAGYYWIRVDTGNYELILHPAPNASYWDVSACSNDTISLSITDQYTTIDTSFTHNAIAYCPLLNVELSTPFLRRCFNSNYFLSYCNTGTASASNAYIDVNFDDYLSLNTSLIATSWTMISPNVYRFEIGDVGIGECGTIPLTVMVSCDAILGQTHCSEAQIFPSSNCLLPTWENAIIDVNGICVNDSIIFTLSNIGNETSTALNYSVIQDTTLTALNSFTILAGQSIQVVIPALNGSTYTMIAQQEIGYPAILGDSLVSVSIEGCGGASNTGIITQFNSYDGSPFLDIDCRMNIGSYDPNDKQGFPLGYGSEHLIQPNLVLDYQIRFQNTGTDTAFTVIVRDTIPESLNIATLVAGSSSHEYTYFIHGENHQVIDFIFNNIQLADSNVNEPASHGFIKFKINQVADNEIGTIIENKAGIYFDFNEPIITNSTYHKIGENFIDENVVGLLTPSASDQLQFVVYPNPSKDDINIELKNAKHDNYQIQLFNSVGNSVLQRNVINNKVVLQKGSLPAGLYLYQISNQEGVKGNGKLVVY